MKLCIITINYNNAEGLRKTLASVASQTFRDFEHIIVDGGSTDESVEIIRQYADNEDIRPEGYKAIRQENSQADNPASSPHHLITLSPIIWISELDKGIYNAMNKGIEIAIGKRTINAFNRSELVEDKNKGIRMAKGEYVLFLNSGDCFIDETALQIVVDSDIQEDVCYFDADFVYPGGKVQHHQYPDELSFEFFWQDALCHQATWYRIDALRDMEGYDEKYKIIGDTAINIDLCLIHNYTYKHYPKVLSVFDANGISISKDGINLIQQEFDSYYKEKFSPSLYNLFVNYRNISQSAIYRRFEKLQHNSSKRIVIWFIRMISFFEKLFV